MSDAHTKTQINIRLDNALAQRLDDWLTGQVLPPSKTVFIEQAIRQLLDRVEADNN